VILENEDAGSGKARITARGRLLDVNGMRTILQSSLLLLVALALVPAVGQAAGKASYSRSSENRVFVLLNHIRSEHGLAPFTASTALRGSAREHSADMIVHDYFEHNSARETFDKRIRRFLASPLVGEDIAWGSGSYGTPAGLVSLWMHSSAHRHIILMPSLHRLGLGIATGTFDGTPGAVMATADFAA
jgi:uncharacterized protein YkwD